MQLWNQGVKLLWDTNIHWDNAIEARRPYIGINNQKDKSCIIVDIALPADGRVKDGELPGHAEGD